MAAPLRKKNTLEQTGFALTDTGIKYRDKFYIFDEITETRVARHVLEHKVVLVNSTYHYSISIVMILKSGEMIQVTEQPTWLSDSKLSSVQYIENQFSIISEKTWDIRVEKYTQQIREKGYFDYNGWLFYPNQKVIQDTKKNKVYNLDSIELLKSPEYITVKEKNVGLGSKLMQSLVGKPSIIITRTDTDVFFTLLKHFFDLSWSH